MTSTAQVLATAQPQVAGTRRRPRAVPLVVGGLLVLEIIWALVVPPFRGSDEFDHVYRAAAAARGQLFVEPADATRGTGAWLNVPRDIVTAARVQCQDLRYTVDADCVGSESGDNIRIASGAGRYHPIYYALVGAFALPFSGVWALLAMRLASILLCTAMFALALVTARRWAQSVWPTVAVAACCTPVLIYSAAIVAPNGLEMLAGVALWTGLIGLLGPRSDHRVYFGTVSAIAGITLATLRPLGSVWCVLIAAHALLAMWPARGMVKRVLLNKTTVATALICAAAIVHAVVYVIAFDALRVGIEASAQVTFAAKINYVAGLVPLWVLQSVAAFPLRNEATHPVVYVSFLLLFLSLLVLALRHGKGGFPRLALLATCFTSIAFPFVTSVRSFEEHQGAWQGRYGLPFAVGIAILAGYALDRRVHSLRPRWALVGGLLFVVSQVVAPTAVLLKESEHSPLSGTDQWLQPSPWLVVPLATAAALALWFAAVQSQPRWSRRDD